MTTAISIENISKKYIIKHQKQGSYITLRDTLTEGFKAVSKRILKSDDTLNDSYEEFWALRDVTLDIKQGDRVGIIGRNGAGKSTLLKILSRITEPTSGRIKIAGRVASLLEVGTGFHPELTGRENIFLNGAILGMSRTEISTKFDEIVEFAEVEKFLDTPVKRYSSGMYVRLAFAVAAHLEPEILIVDEVLAVGDAKFQKKCLGKMEEVGKEGRTVFFVSHNMASISQLCSRSIWMDSGRLVQVGETQTIINNYLRCADNTEAEARFAPPEKAKVGFRRVWIANESGEVASEMDVNEPFYVNLSVEVRERVKDIDISVWIQNVQGIRVCMTSFSDSNNGKIVELTPGLHNYSFKIPGKFLVPDHYNLIIQAHVPNVSSEDIHRGVAGFTVLETGSNLRKYDATRHACVLVDFPWTVKSAEH